MACVLVANVVESRRRKAAGHFLSSPIAPFRCRVVVSSSLSSARSIVVVCPLYAHARRIVWIRPRLDLASHPRMCALSTLLIDKQLCVRVLVHQHSQSVRECEWMRVVELKNFGVRSMESEFWMFSLYCYYYDEEMTQWFLLNNIILVSVFVLVCCIWHISDINAHATWYACKVIQPCFNVHCTS